MEKKNGHKCNKITSQIKGECLERERERVGERETTELEKQIYQTYFIKIL